MHSVSERMEKRRERFSSGSSSSSVSSSVSSNSSASRLKEKSQGSVTSKLRDVNLHGSVVSCLKETKSQGTVSLRLGEKNPQGPVTSQMRQSSSQRPTISKIREAHIREFPVTADRSQETTTSDGLPTIENSVSDETKLHLPKPYSYGFVNPEQPGYVGFANLPNQVHRKSVKKGFEFTLMVVGESGLGKSTLVNSLFLTDLYPERHIPTANEKISQTVKIDASTVEIEERGVKLRLTVVDTPGFGDSLNSVDCFKPIIQYVDDQFERYLNDESGLNRRHIVDNRVHCCFYFINPSGHGLRPLDITFMRALHHKVNIVPVIAKADTLTKKEVYAIKRKILDQIDEYGISLYPLPECDSDEDEDYREQCRQLKDAVPFAVVGSNTIIEVKGKKVRGRMYPWGVVEVENPEHCDFIKLRTMLITHMQDLQEVTQEVHYENFRAERLASGGGTAAPRKTSRNRRPEQPMEEDKERELQRKEEELRKMQEQLMKMQAEMEAQKRSNPSPQQNGGVRTHNVV